MFSSNRLRKNLGSRKGSRTGNSGNHLELRVLTQIQFVPWVINSAHTHTKLTFAAKGKLLVQSKLFSSTNTGDSGDKHFFWFNSFGATRKLFDRNKHDARWKVRKSNRCIQHQSWTWFVIQTKWIYGVAEACVIVEKVHIHDQRPRFQQN